MRPHKVEPKPPGGNIYGKPAVSKLAAKERLWPSPKKKAYSMPSLPFAFGCPSVLCGGLFP